MHSTQERTAAEIGKIVGSLIYFESRSKNKASQNLGEFIRLCRDELTVFGADLNWDDARWPGVVHFIKIGINSRAATSHDFLDAEIIEFAKAYFRYQQGHRPTGTKNESKALRAIEAALLRSKGRADIEAIDMSVLDEAAMLGRLHYSAYAAYHCGREIQRLACFVSDKKLISADLRTWKSPIKKPNDVRIQTGAKARAIHEKKLPDDSILNAIAEIFANDPQDPKDIFTSSTFALLMCAPSRLSEILELPVDCEVEEIDSKGSLRYGWRFYSGKGYEGDIKWVPDVMVPTAKEALRRIRNLTDESRKLARRIEENPSHFFRREICQDLAGDTHLSASEFCGLLSNNVEMRDYWATMLPRLKLGSNDGAYTLNAICDYILSCQPDGFPWLNKEKKVKYSTALFCMNKNLLHGKRAVHPCVLWAPSVATLNNDLSPRYSLKTNTHQSIFDRWGYKASDGRRLKMTSHQIRHLLNTLANRGGLSQEQIAKWSGRANALQNRVYNHINEYEMVAAAQALDASLTLYGPKGDVPKLIPVDIQEINPMERGPVHVTEFGVCVHDYTMSPCEKFRDCINCEEQVCIKGDRERLKRIKLRLQEVEIDLASAEEATTKNFMGADRWAEHQFKTVARLRQLVEILEDSKIPDGTQIKLRDGSDYSHLQRVIKLKTLSALECESHATAPNMQIKQLAEKGRG